MNNLELQTQAVELIKKNKWDFHLIKLYFNTNHFKEWMKHDNFTELNFGLKNISFEQRKIEILIGQKEINFLKAKFNDINFMIGGCDELISLEDDTLSLQHIILYIDEKIVMKVQFTLRNMEGYFLPESYSIFSVKEFHNHRLINDLLIKTSEANRQKRLERNRKDRIELDNSYKDKFNLDEQ